MSCQKLGSDLRKAWLLFLLFGLCQACAQHKPAPPAPPSHAQTVSQVQTLISHLDLVATDTRSLQAKMAPPPLVDDRYGPGKLGPRILLHTDEVTQVLPERLEIARVAQPHDLPEDLRAKLAPSASEPPQQSEEGPGKLSLKSDVADYLAGKDTKPRKARLLRVWDIREPRLRKTSPIQPAQYDALSYLQTLGLKSIYDLSPLARKLIVPKKTWPKLAIPIIPRTPFDPTAPTQAEWQQMIDTAARFFGLDPAFVAAMIQVESNFDHRAISTAGAQGAMQIMPKTQELLGLQDPFDARANIYAGCAYIRALLNKYERVDLALAAYNAGPRAVDKAHGIPPFRETQNYVRKVTELWQGTAPEKLTPSSRVQAKKNAAPHRPKPKRRKKPRNVLPKT
ncbi:MAG: lytic transglycosylase domain-containing protein [Desulfovibrio sp.]|nr:lytic transglycosylase domain-containing protein [Desulfovibrio sp.]